MKILLTLVFALLASPAVSQMFGDSKPVEDTIYWRAEDAGKVHISKCIEVAKNGVFLETESWDNRAYERSHISVYLTEDAVYELKVNGGRTKADGTATVPTNDYGMTFPKYSGASKTATCLEYKKLNRD